MSDVSPSTEGASLARTSGTLFVARIVASLGFFVAVVVLARALGPDGRGALAFATVSALIVAKVATVGLGGTAVVFAARRPAERAALLSTHVCFVVAANAGVIAVAVSVLLLFPSTRPAGIDAPLLALMIPATVLTALTEWGLAFLLGARRVAAQGIGMAVGPWLYALALLVVAAATGLDVTSAAAAWVVGYLGWASLLLGLAVRAVGLERPRRALLTESLAFGLRAWGGGLARSANARVDQILMAYLSTQAALGIYASAVNASEVLLYAPGAVAMAFAPAVAAAAHGDRLQQTLRTFRVTLLLTVLTLVPALLLGPLLIPLAFGDSFDGSVVPFLILAPGAIGFLMMRLFSSALMGSSYPGRSSLPAVIALVSGVVLDFALVPPYGATGAAIASTAAFWIGGVGAIGLYREAVVFPLRELLPGRSDADALLSRSQRFWRRRVSSV